ncbi:MAG: gliding motility protein [Myxococcaceae bacterium]
MENPTRPSAQSAPEKTFEETLVALERSGRIDELVQLLESRARDSVGADATPWLTRAAELVRTRLRSPDQAEELLRRALALGGPSKTALLGLKALYEQKQDAAALADTLEQLADLGTGADAALLYSKAAELYEARLNRRDRAVLCLQRAIRVDPEDRALGRRVRQLFASERKWQAALESLDADRKRGAQDGLGEEYALLAEGLVEDPTEHVVVHAAVEAALAVEPENPRAKRIRDQLGKFDKTWRDQVRVLRSASLEERDRKKAARMSLLVAKLFAWHDASAVQKVREAVERAVLLWPAMPEALVFVERLADRNGDAAPAILLFEKMLSEAKEKPAQAELWIRIGLLKLTRQQDQAGALAAFESALGIDPSRGDAASLGAELRFEQHDAAGAVALFEKHLGTLKVKTARAVLHLRIAELCDHSLGDVRAARAHYEAALGLDPTNAQAAFVLAKEAVAQKDVAKATSLLDLAAAASRPAADRATLFDDAAAVFEAEGNASAAYAARARALRLEPLSPTRLAQTQAAARQAKADADFAALLASLSEAVDDPTPLLRVHAQWLAEVMGQPEEARTVWQKVLERHPGDTAAKKAIKSLQKALARSPAPDGAAPVPADPAAATLGDLEALRAAAQKLEATGDVAERASLLKRLLELAPQDVWALEQQSQLAALMGQWEDAARATEQLVTVASTEEGRREARERLAQLQGEKLDRKDEAVDTYLALASEGHASAAVLGGLERLAAAGVRVAEISRALAPLYAQSGDYQRQTASLLVQLNAAQEASEKTALLRLLAQTHEHHLADSRAAFDFCLRGIGVDPTDKPFLQEARRLAGELSGHVELARALMGLGGPQVDARNALALLQTAAEVAEEGGAFDDALAALDLALERTPSDPAVLGRKVALARRAKRFDVAEAALRAQLLVAEPEHKSALYVELADASEQLGRPRDAAQALLEAIRAGGATEESRHLPRLAALLEQAGRTAELATVLSRQAELAEAAGDKDAVARFSLRRAQILESTVGSQAEAVANYAAILEKRPSDADALAALEKLLADPTCREQAARALMPAYEALKDHRKQVMALDAIADVSVDAGEKVKALKLAAYVHLHHLRQPELAFAALARAMRISPADGTLRTAARHAAEDADALDTFAEVVGELVEETASEVGGAKIALHRELAEVQERKLNNRSAAMVHWRALLALDPKNADALKALVRLHRAGEEWGPLADVIEKLAALTPPAEKAAYYREAALLYESRLNDKERAAQAWREVAECDALDREAAQRLERLYTELDRPTELAFALELRKAQEGQSPQGREVAFRLASLRRERLHDGAAGLQVYRQILEEDPTHTGTREVLEAWARSTDAESSTALALLDPVLAKAGEHARRIAIREARTEGARREEKLRLFEEIRAIYERDLSQPDLAFLSTLKAFAAGLDRPGLQPELERLAKETNAFEELAAIYESAAGEGSGSDAEAQQFLRRAASLREQLGQTEEAIRLWKDLLVGSPQDRQALEALGRLYERAKNARSLSEVYSRQAQLAQDPAERFGLLLKAGEAFESAGEDGRAIEAFRSALAIRKRIEGLEALDRLYGRTKRVAEQADVLAQLAEASAGDSRNVFLLRRAQLLEKESDPALAVAAYAQVLERAPNEPQAVAALERMLAHDGVRAEAARWLEPVYRSVNDMKKLADLLDVRLANAGPGKRVELCNEVALLREALGQKQLAFTARMRAFSERPDVEASREELERLAADTGAFEELASAYEDQLERGGVGEGLALDLWRRLAVIYGDRLNRPEQAVVALEQVSRRAPKNLDALEALARIHRKTHAYRELALVIRREVAAEPAVDAQVTLLFELAALAQEQLSDKPLAAQAYSEILTRKSDDAVAMKALGQVLVETERYPELAALIVQEIHLSEQTGALEQAAELRVRLGRLKMSRLSDPRGAIDAFLQVLATKPGHAGAIGALEEMARSDSPLRGEAASALEPLFASAGDLLRLVQMYEARATSETAPHERAALLRKVAELYTRSMDNAPMGFVAATRALREVPDDETSLTLCLNLAPLAEAEDELTEVLEEVAERAADDKARSAMYGALGRLAEQRHRDGDALAYYRRLLELKPSDLEGLRALARLLSKAGQHSELLEVLRRRLALAEEPQERIQLLHALGEVQHQGIKDASGGLATYRRLLELAPEDATALAATDALCLKLERWAELADVLARRIELLGPEASLDLRFRLAELREARLGDKAGALELYREILNAQPAHLGALAQLEAWFEREPQASAVGDLLIHAYRTTGTTAKLARLLETRVNLTPELNERKAMLLEVSRIRESQEDPEGLFLALYRAFREDPNDSDVLGRLMLVAQQTQSWDELAVALEEGLPKIVEAKDAAHVAFRLAALHDEKLRDPAKAAETFEKARALDPSISPNALPALVRLYSELDQPVALFGALEQLADHTQDAGQKAALLFQLGEHCEKRMENPERAAAAYEALLTLEPKHLPSLQRLEALYTAANEDTKLHQALSRMMGLVVGAERERVIAKLAHVSAAGMQDFESAIALYRELLAKNPRHEQAWAQLEALLEKAGQAEALQKLLRDKLAQTLDPRELVRLNHRVGDVTWRLLRQPDEAIPHFKATLERDARHPGALQSLREIYEATGRHEELVAVLRKLVPLQEGGEGVKALRIRIAEVLADAGRREEALDAARRALEIDPHRVPELERIHAIFTRLRAFNEAVRTLEQKVEVYSLLEEREQVLRTLFEIAELWQGPAGKPENAGPVLERILEADPANNVAYKAATTLYAQHNDWRGYAAVLDRYIPNLVTDEEKLGALRELAKVREHKLGQKSSAFLALCRALQLNPSDDALREEVERLADETGSYEELAAVYEEIADELPRGPLAERLYTVLARVHDERLDDAPSAERSLRKILEFDPTNATALEKLAGMFARRGQDPEYLVALEQQMEAAGTLEHRKGILREMARVYEQRLENLDEAAAALLRALDLEPDLESVDQLAALYRRQQAFEKAALTLARGRDLAPSLEEQARRQVEIAQVYERDLLRDESAAEAYRQALEIDPAQADALQALERLYTKLDRPAELLAVYERELELTQDYRERVKLLFKSATIWETQFQNLANADACVAAVLPVDPQNLAAIKTLERLRRADQRWADLIAALEMHTALCESPAERAEVLVEMGDVWSQQLKQVDRAVDSYTLAHKANPDSVPAVHALGLLYERSGNWPFALEMLQREAQLQRGQGEVVQVHHRIGKIHEDMLQDLASAKAAYSEALRANPGHLPSLRALRGIQEAENDFTGLEATLRQEAEETQESEAKGRAYLELARFCQDKKDDRDRAAEYYSEAIRLAPGLMDAAVPLADVYVSREDWPAAERMMDVIVKEMSAQTAAQPGDVALGRELCRQQYRLGYVAEKLGNSEKALHAYGQAYQLDATYLPALEGYGHGLVQAKRYEEALKVYQTILIHHRDDLTDLEVVEVYWQIGEIHIALDQLDRAANHFDKALAIDGGHEPTLRAMIGIAEGQGQFDKSVEYRQALVRVLDGDAQFEAYVALGELSHEKLQDTYRAIDAYVGALKLKPDSLAVMDALYGLYRAVRQGPKAADVLKKMLAHPELATDPHKAKRVHFAMGEIARDELRDIDRAAASFNAALDLDPRFVEAFTKLEAMLGEAKQWRALEENYTRMIQRLPKTDDTHAARTALWRALGDLYLRVLKQEDGALMAYQVVATALPDDAAVQETYAELAGRTPMHEQNAIVAYQRALAHTQKPGKVLSSLAELFAKTKDYDGAYLSAQAAASFAGETSATDKEILAKLTPYAKKREVAQQGVTDRLWHQHLLHPNARSAVAQLLGILFTQAGHAFAVPLTQYQVNPKKHRIDVPTAQEYQIHHYRYVARLLGMENVELYSPFLVATRERLSKRNGDAAPEPLVGVEICFSQPVCLKVGGKFFQQTVQKEVYYLLGRTLALLRPELILTQVMSMDRLEAVVQAALVLAKVPVRGGTAPAIEAERKLLDRALPEPARAAMGRVIRGRDSTQLLKELRHLPEAAEFTGVRAGLFAAGEAEPVKKLVAAETGPGFRVQQRQKVRELMVFSVSDDLRALRAAAGLKLEIPKAPAGRR